MYDLKLVHASKTPTVWLFVEMELHALSKAESGSQKKKATWSHGTMNTFLPLSCLSSTYLTQVQQHMQIYWQDVNGQNLHAFLVLWCVSSRAVSLLTSTLAQFVSRATPHLEKSDIHLDQAAEAMSAWYIQSWFNTWQVCQISRTAVGKHTSELPVLSEIQRWLMLTQLEAEAIDCLCCIL